MSVAKGIEKTMKSPVMGDIDEKREERSEKRKEDIRYPINDMRYANF